MATQKNAETTAVATAEPKEIDVYVGLSREQLEDIQTFEEAIRAASIAYADIGGVIEADDYMPVDKDELINREFMIMDWSEGRSDDYKDDKGNPLRFAVVKLITADNRKLFFTDGSTGVFKRLDRWALEGRRGGIHVARGLKKSEYGLDADKKVVKLGSPEQVSKGATYYL